MSADQLPAGEQASTAPAGRKPPLRPAAISMPNRGLLVSPCSAGKQQQAGVEDHHRHAIRRKDHLADARDAHEDQPKPAGRNESPSAAPKYQTDEPQAMPIASDKAVICGLVKASPPAGPLHIPVAMGHQQEQNFDEVDQAQPDQGGFPAIAGAGHDPRDQACTQR
jgi:hypothetical protein